MQTVGEMRHAAIVEGSLMRIADALEELEEFVKCYKTLKDKEKDKNKENERD